MVNERNYGIDLLRLVLMFMVCMLHTLGQGGILSACEVGTLNYKVYWFLEIFSYCAVDGFAIISGYMATDKPRRFEKLIEMWFQVFFYSFVVTLVLSSFGINISWNLLDIIRCAMPVTFGKFWYFTAYFALFLSVPVLNKFIFGIDVDTAKRTLIILFFLFSVLGIVSDPFETKWGYSAIWLIVLYLIGALSKRSKLFETKNNFTLVLLWMCCIFLTWFIHVFGGVERLTNYVSPTIVLSGIIMVILFSRIDLKGNIISKLSPLAFGIYLFQLNQVVWNVILKGSFSFVASENTVLGTVYVIAYASLIFVIGLLVELLRRMIAKAMKISLISAKSVELVDVLITKLLVFLN